MNNPAPIRWTTAELAAEWNYVYHERIGLLAANARPTPRQVALARQEADEHIQRLTFIPMSGK